MWQPRLKPQNTIAQACYPPLAVTRTQYFSFTKKIPVKYLEIRQRQPYNAHMIFCFVVHVIVLLM